MKAIVLGAGGQLGQCFRLLIESLERQEFTFYSKRQIDITDLSSLEMIISDEVDYVINLAAYTAVDQAEVDIEKATKINGYAPMHMAELCKKFNSVLIHISTDYVYHNDLRRPLVETDPCQPKSHYGRSKLLGEQGIEEATSAYYILRTSWLYSEYGNNFLKTISRLAQEREKLTVVDDQLGTPTSCHNLSRAILSFIDQKAPFGIYNMSDEGQCTWFEFADYIASTKNYPAKITPISSEAYGAEAHRPSYSVMNIDKLKNTISFSTQSWQEACSEVLVKI